MWLLFIDVMLLLHVHVCVCCVSVDMQCCFAAFMKKHPTRPSMTVTHPSCRLWTLYTPGSTPAVHGVHDGPCRVLGHHLREKVPGEQKTQAIKSCKQRLFITFNPTPENFTQQAHRTPIIKTPHSIMLFGSMDSGWKAEDMPDLSTWHILITGGSSGLGFAAARELLRKNAHVYLLSENMAEGHQLRLRLRWIVCAQRTHCHQPHLHTTPPTPPQGSITAQARAPQHCRQQARLLPRRPHRFHCRQTICRPLSIQKHPPPRAHQQCWRVSPLRGS